MGRFFGLLNDLIKGHRVLYWSNFVLQFFAVFFTVFTSFLGMVLVDALSGIDTLREGSFVELFVVDIITIGRGPEFLCENLWILPVALITSAAIAAIIMVTRMVLRSYTSAAINKNMQYRLFSRLIRLPYPYFKKRKSGDLIQTCTRDLDVTRKFLIADCSLVFYTVYIVILCAGILISISPVLTLVSLSFLPIMFVYSFFLIKVVRKRYRETDDSEARMTDKISENLYSARVVKAYHNENLEINRFEEKLDDYKHRFIRWRILSSLFFSTSDILVFGSKVIALVFGLYLALTGEITAGTLYISFTFVNMMVWPMRDLAMILSNMGQYMASADRIALIYREEEEDINSGLTPEITGEVRFEDVGFSYIGSNDKVLRHISFSAKPGDTVAIIGKTGSGKSTLMSLLTRLYDYDEGHIYLGDTELKDIKKAYLRREVVPVLQDPFLFSRTVKENIRIAYPEATDEKIVEAAKIADLDRAVSSFKLGYDTPVGEKGSTLSGGQRQRVAIARSLISSPPVLIFDDSLSAVDTATDLRIRQNLKERQGHMTTFIVTHRVATAKDADLIIVLEDGTLSEIGTHEELIGKEGLYRRIAEIQDLA